MTSQIRSILIVAVVFALVGSVAYVRSHSQPREGGESPGETAVIAEKPAAEGALPRMVDLGAKSCIPCKKMAPILDELKTELAGKAEIEFIDVWENTAAGAEYGIRTIPTQIFYDRSGREVWRHEGFLAKADILSRLREAGMN